MEFDPCIDDAVDRDLDAALRDDEDYFDYGGGSYGRCEPEWMNPPARVRRRGALRRWAARDDKRGPFTGHHRGVPNPVLPPEWDMTPWEYREAVRQDAEPHFDLGCKVSTAAAVAGGAATWPTLLMEPDVTVSGIANSILLLPIVAHAVGGAFTALRGVDYLLWRRHDFTVLGDRDPAQVVSIVDLPSEVVEVLLTLLDMDDSTAPKVSPVQRAERLDLCYRVARVFTTALEGEPHPTLEMLHQRCRTEVLELAQYASTVSDPWATQAAGRLTLRLAYHESVAKQRSEKYRQENRRTKVKTKGMTAGYLAEAPTASAHKVGQPGCECFECLTSLPINSTAQFTADALAAPAVRPTPALTAQQRWNAALATHEKVIEAWTKIVTDPLAALDHTLLLDVTQPRTAAFIEAYGHAQDLAAIHGITMPTDESEQRAYATAVRKTDEAWTEAVRHAKHVHLNWLPAEEEKRARQAKGLLSTAADETVPVHLRAEAAKKAADLLAKVASFVLPEAATQALETSLRAIEASVAHTAEDSPAAQAEPPASRGLLTPTRQREPA